MDISHCGFISKPVLLTSVGGFSDHGYLVGSSNPYNVSETRFKLYVFPRDQGEPITPKHAADEHWHINYHATGKIC